MEISFDRSKFAFSDVNATSGAYAGSRLGRQALTVFSKGKDGRSIQVGQQELRRTEEQRSTSPRHVSCLVKAIENITVAPRCRQIVMGKIETEEKQSLPSLVVVEPAQIPIAGILPACGLSRTDSTAQVSPGLTSRDSHAETRARYAYVMVANFTDEKLTIPKATVLGVAEEVGEPEIDRLNAVSGADAGQHEMPQTQKRNEVLYHKLLRGKLEHLIQKERQLLEPVLLKYTHVFHDEESNKFKGTNVVEHEILLNDTRPIRRPPNRTPYALREEMESHVQKMLDQGVIRESSSPWSVPAILVPKRSLDGKPRYRFCVDFRALNAVTKFDSYPLPVFEETSTLYVSKYFSVLDCHSGFWQVSIKEEHRERTAFTVPSGHYEFNRLPFGLSNSPANFQRLMDTVLRSLVSSECSAFLDDVVVYSRTAKEHAQRLENVIQRFDKANLQLHPGKCKFA